MSWRWVALLLVASALAGCNDAPSHSMEGMHDHGAFYTCADGTVLDPGDYPDHHASDFNIASKCPGEGEPASVTLEVSPATITLYESTHLQWDITPAADGDGHIDSTDVQSATSAGDPTGSGFGNTVATAPGAQGAVTRQSAWTPDSPGIYFLRAHAKIDGEDVWSDAVRFEVKEIQPTGTTHTVTVSPAGPLASLDPSSLTVTLGDAVQWDNQDLLSHTFHSTDGPDVFDTGSIAARSQSSEILFLRLGDVDYENDDGSLTGVIHVLPA